MSSQADKTKWTTFIFSTIAMLCAGNFFKSSYFIISMLICVCLFLCFSIV